MTNKFDWEAELRLLCEPEKMGVIAALTPDWHLARRGRVTASKRAATIAKRSSSAWNTMRDEILVELSPLWEHREFDNAAMKWGRDHEGEAIANASLAYGVEAVEPGFVVHPEFYFAGATPDFFMGPNVSGQIKCPFNPENHLRVFYDRKIPDQYYHQVNWEAWCTGRSKILFMSYDPRQPVAQQCAFVEADVNAALCNVFRDNLLAFKRLLEDNVTPVKSLTPIGIPELF